MMIVKFKYWLGMLLVAMGTLSCVSEEDVEVYKPVSLGLQGEVMVVMNNKMWDGQMGDLVRARLAEEILYYPQIEYLFDVKQVSYGGFEKTTKRYRNILQMEVNDHPKVESGVSILQDLYAKDQSVVKVTGKSQQDLANVFAENSEMIKEHFLKMEINRLEIKLKGTRNSLIEEQLEKKYNVSVTVPGDMSLSLEKENLFVLERKRMRTKNGGPGDIQQYIICYQYPYKDDSTFTKSYQIEKRDSILKKYFKGVTDSSYMITAPEELAPLFVKEKLFKGIYAYEIRGLYSMVNDFRGGPFMSLSILDEKRNRVITIEGHVFAPKFNKREFMMEVETIINTLTLH